MLWHYHRQRRGLGALRRSQSELHPLEEGKHAAESGMDLKSYAEMAGKDRSTLARKVMGWRVLSMCHVAHAQVYDSWRTHGMENT